MKIVNFDADAVSGSPDSPEWHAWRAQGIGGSDAAVIARHAGLLEDAPQWVKTAHQLWAIKTGRVEDTFRGNWATERGRQGEDPVRQAYEAATGILVSPMFGEMELHPATRASFDGLAFDFSVITEIKCPSAAVHAAAREGRVVDYYRPQLAHQALVAWGHPDEWDGGNEVHFVTGVPERLAEGNTDPTAIAVVRLKARELATYAAQLLEAEMDFWRCVTENRPPAGEGWEALAAQWLRHKEAAARAEEARKAVEAAMREYVEAHHLLVGEGGGVRFQKEHRKGSVDWDKALKLAGVEIPDEIIEQARRPGTESWVCRQVKGG